MLVSFPATKHFRPPWKHILSVYSIYLTDTSRHTWKHSNRWWLSIDFYYIAIKKAPTQYLGQWTFLTPLDLLFLFTLLELSLFRYQNFKIQNYLMTCKMEVSLLFWIVAAQAKSWKECKLVSVTVRGTFRTTTVTLSVTFRSWPMVYVDTLLHHRPLIASSNLFSFCFLVTKPSKWAQLKTAYSSLPCRLMWPMKCKCKCFQDFQESFWKWGEEYSFFSSFFMEMWPLELISHIGNVNKFWEWKPCFRRLGRKIPWAWASEDFEEPPWGPWSVHISLLV